MSKDIEVLEKKLALAMQLLKPFAIAYNVVKDEEIIYSGIETLKGSRDINIRNYQLAAKFYFGRSPRRRLKKVS